MVFTFERQNIFIVFFWEKLIYDYGIQILNNRNIQIALPILIHNEYLTVLLDKESIGYSMGILTREEVWVSDSDDLICTMIRNQNYL